MTVGSVVLDIGFFTVSGGYNITSVATLVLIDAG
jgi:hypothetical protein